MAPAASSRGYGACGLRRVPGVVLVLIAMTAGACGAGRAAAEQSAAAGHARGLLLVFVREFSFDAGVDDVTDEARMTACVSEGIRRVSPELPVVPFEAFRELAFPHLDPRAAPREPRYLSLVLDREDVLLRVRPLGIRHVAFIGGVTEARREGAIECFGAYAGAGCFGALSWDKSTRLAAVILDLGGAGPERLEAAASGTSWLAVLGILPLGAASDTEGAACLTLGEKLGHHLSGASPGMR